MFAGDDLVDAGDATREIENVNNGKGAWSEAKALLHSG
jgi:hypothetical protein